MLSIYELWTFYVHFTYPYHGYVIWRRLWYLVIFLFDVHLLPVGVRICHHHHVHFTHIHAWLYFSLTLHYNKLFRLYKRSLMSLRLDRPVIRKCRMVKEPPTRQTRILKILHFLQKLKMSFKAVFHSLFISHSILVQHMLYFEEN